MRIEQLTKEEAEELFNIVKEKAPHLFKKLTENISNASQSCENSTFKFGENNLIREPFMYFYNLSGSPRQLIIDFNNNKIVKSIPKIREDNKLVIDIDTDNWINKKYQMLYYEIDRKLDFKTEHMYWVTNDKSLDANLNKLGILMGLWGNEIKDFMHYTSFNLKETDHKFFKCYIYTEDILNKEIPISFHEEPEYFIRRYVKFEPIEKEPKNILNNNLKIQTSQRVGLLRCVEIGFQISEGKIK